MKIHHVGITVTSTLFAMLQLKSLAAIISQETVPSGVGHSIPEWDCECFPMGMVEFVLLGSRSRMRDYHEGYQAWTGIGSAIVLHHIAFGVKDYDEAVKNAKEYGKVVGEGTIGYTGKRVAFLHPTMFGILIELVEE